MTELVAIRAFGPYGIGQLISDQAIIQAVLAGPHVIDVVKIGDVDWTSPGGTTSPPSNAPGQAATASYSLTAATSYSVAFSTAAPPAVRLLDASGAEVWTDVQVSGSALVLSFPAPFTGTLLVG